jgi:polyisoprenoid-binding protein YceI
MISDVNGHFTRFEGQIVTAGDPLKSEVTATIDMASVDTASAARDEHLRTADSFEVESTPR